MALSEGRPLPPKIANPPILLDGLEIYLRAFFDLCSERQSGFGLSPIPRSAILAWGRQYASDDPELIEDLLFHVRALDNTFMKHMEDKGKKDKNGPPMGKRDRGQQRKLRRL